jgi:outer membrane murein-binding lipoprotein Lpp
MKIRYLFLCAALTASLSACAKKDPIDKMVSMMEDLGDAVDNANGDCGKMADAVEAVADKYKGDLPAMKEASENAKKDKDQAKKLMDKYGDRIQKVMPKMMGMMKCADDPKMKAVSDKLKGLV